MPNRLPLPASPRAYGVLGLLILLTALSAISAPALLAAWQADPGPSKATARGELIYVPVYSSVLYDNGKRTFELAATLSIHNVNPDQPIRILRADYHGTDGKLIKNYLPKPLVIGALATTNVFIEKANTAGGTGANFLVEWEGDSQAVSPVVEALMVNASSNLGIAFTTSGKIVRATGGH